MAQEPAEARGGKRSDARLLVFGRETNSMAHCRFHEIERYFKAMDVLVLNSARVVPTLLDGKDADGLVVAVSIHSLLPDGTWHCLVAPAAACRRGAVFTLGPEGQVTARLLAQTGAGVWRVGLDPGDADTLYKPAKPVYPNYLRHEPPDPEHYQTVYGSRPGSVLFPSAGRHFTQDILDNLRKRGLVIAEVTLWLAARSHHHIRRLFRKRVAEGGAGDVEAEIEVERKSRTNGFEFPYAERYEVTEETAEVINHGRDRGGRIVVCGTSVIRTLETVARADGHVSAGSGFTRLQIAPGHRFRVSDAFITNPHQPKSSELLLTAAFAGREPLLEVYQRELIPGNYLFHEVGDAMLIV